MDTKKQKKLILFAEDDLGIAKLILDTLQTTDIQPLPSLSVEQANLIIASGIHVDLLVLDFELGERSSLDILKSVKEAGKDIPTIFFSGLDPNYLKEIASAFEFNVIEAIQKPNFEHLKQLAQAI